MSQKLRRIMVKNVVTIEPHATAKKAAELMDKNDIGCLIVVDSGKPVGIVTERDMLKRVIQKSQDPKDTRVVDIMSNAIITASPDDSAGEAAKLMIERNIKKLPIVEKDRLVGLVTLTDLIRTEGVVEFLSGLSLNGAPKHMKKAINIYFDPQKQHRRRCPLTVKDGFALGCQNTKCMWWVEDECAVTKLSRQITNEIVT
jgi:CBS domain-containing protein